MIVVLNLFDIVEEKKKDYARYLRLVQPILDRWGARVMLYGLTRMIYMGNCSQQYCGLIAYKSIEDLRGFSNDPEFQKIRPLRDDSTRNYVLTVIESFPTIDDAAEFLEASGEEMISSTRRRQNAK